MPARKPLISKKLLYDLYVNKRMPVDSMTKHLLEKHGIKIARDTLYRQLKTHKIKLRGIHDLKTDEYTPFRWYLRKSITDPVKPTKDNRASHRKVKFDKNNKNSINLKYLKYLWEKHKGICPYTGIKLKLFTFSICRYKANMKSDVRYASLDRINPNKPYIKGNVQFVAWPINYAKSDMTDKQMKRFIQLIRKKH